MEDLELLLGDLPIPKRGIIHIGAHKGQEVEFYKKCGFNRIMLIEANPEWVRYLEGEFGDDESIAVVGVAIADTIGKIEFHIHSSRSGSTEPASILKMKDFKRIVSSLHIQETIEVEVTTLDNLFQEMGFDPKDYNFLSADVQGAEKQVFLGAPNILRHLDAVISEVNLIEMYEGCALEAEIVDLLGKEGFRQVRGVYHNLYEGDKVIPAWGECLFVKNEIPVDE